MRTPTPTALHRLKYHGLITLFCVIFTLTSSTCHAHVKWFITDPSAFNQYAYPLTWFTGAIVFGGLLYILINYWISRLSVHHPRLNQMLFGAILLSPANTPIAHWPGIALRAAMAVLLVMNLVEGHFIAPHFDTLGHSQFYQLTQAALLVCLVIHPQVFAIGLGLTCTLLFFILPFSSTIDYFPELIAIALAMYFTSPKINVSSIPINEWRDRFNFTPSQVARWLQAGLGLQLIILTFHDKLLSPAYGLAFLDKFPHFNFIKYFNLWEFNDIYFVLGAGIAELCFGLMLFFNIAARISLGLVIFFFTLTSLILDISELVGHLPILVAAVILFIYPPVPRHIRKYRTGVYSQDLAAKTLLIKSS